MGTTPIYALRYPEPADLADVPTDMHELATDVEAALGGKGAAPGYGTTLPASPVDGQEAILVDSTTNPTYQWRFRYNSGSSSSYKWEFVGGASARSSVDAFEGTSSTSYADLATVGPQLTIPRSGDYHVRWGAIMQASGAGLTAAMAIPNLGLSFRELTVIVTLGMQVALWGEFPFAALTAGTVAKCQYKTSAGTALFVERSLYLTPVRVA